MVHEFRALAALAALQPELELPDFPHGLAESPRDGNGADGAGDGLLSRAVVVLNADNQVIYTEQVPSIGQEPNYDAALAARPVRLMNHPEAVRIMFDKRLCHARLSDAGVSVPEATGLPSYRR